MMLKKEKNYKIIHDFELTEDFNLDVAYEEINKKFSKKELRNFSNLTIKGCLYLIPINKMDFLKDKIEKLNCKLYIAYLKENADNLFIDIRQNNILYSYEPRKGLLWYNIDSAIIIKVWNSEKNRIEAQVFTKSNVDYKINSKRDKPRLLRFFDDFYSEEPLINSNSFLSELKNNADFFQE